MCRMGLPLRRFPNPSLKGKDMSLRALKELDLPQLRRVEASIAGIERRSEVEQRRLACLLGALRQERAELLQARGGRRAVLCDAAALGASPAVDEERGVIAPWQAVWRSGGRPGVRRIDDAARRWAAS